MASRGVGFSEKKHPQGWCQRGKKCRHLSVVFFEKQGRRKGQDSTGQAAGRQCDPAAYKKTFSAAWLIPHSLKACAHHFCACDLKIRPPAKIAEADFLPRQCRLTQRGLTSAQDTEGRMARAYQRRARASFGADVASRGCCWWSRSPPSAGLSSPRPVGTPRHSASQNDAHAKVKTRTEPTPETHSTQRVATCIGWTAHSTAAPHPCGLYQVRRGLLRILLWYSLKTDTQARAKLTPQAYRQTGTR